MLHSGGATCGCGSLVVICSCLPLWMVSSDTFLFYNFFVVLSSLLFLFLLLLLLSFIRTQIISHLRTITSAVDTRPYFLRVHPPSRCVRKKYGAGDEARQQHTCTLLSTALSCHHYHLPQITCTCLPHIFLL